MRAKPLVLAVALASAALSATGGPRADTDPDQARRAAIVARVGTRTITAGELEDRLAAVPRFQLLTFGATPDAIRRKFLNDVLVPEVLLAAGADERHLESEPPTDHQVARARSNATLRAVRAQIGPATAITAEEVKRYYDENKSRYDSPERLNLWRILCRTREEAMAVTEAARKDSTVPSWSALARDHSLDKATFMRGGNLGFVGPDGTSNEAGLKVEPAVVKAASAVRDGELVPTPVAEAGYFAVIWRRGTVGASHRSVEDVAAQIRDTLWKEKKEQAEKKLLDDLRARDVKEVNEPLLAQIDIQPQDGAIVPRRRPGQVVPLATIGNKPAPVPATTASGK